MRLALDPTSPVMTAANVVVGRKERTLRLKKKKKKRDEHGTDTCTCMHAYSWRAVWLSARRFDKLEEDIAI